MGLVNLSDRAATRLSSGALDVRGWKVRTEVDGAKVGTVEDLLVDDHDQPHFYDVDLGIFRKHVLLPVSEAHPDPDKQVLWVDGMDEERLKEVPRWDQNPERLSAEYEERLRAEYRLLARNGGNGVITETAPVVGPRLARLGDLKEYRIPKGVTDPRGWKVIMGDGGHLGEVSELIVEPTALTARYLDVRVDEKKLSLEPLDRHILVPVDRIRLDRKAKRVVVDGLFARDLTDYPVYGGLPLDDSYASRLDDAFRSGNREIVLESGESRTIHAGDDDLNIRVSGEDVIVERDPRGSEDDG